MKKIGEELHGVHNEKTTFVKTPRMEHTRLLMKQKFHASNKEAFVSKKVLKVNTAGGRSSSRSTEQASEKW